MSSSRDLVLLDGATLRDDAGLDDASACRLFFDDLRRRDVLGLGESFALLSSSSLTLVDTVEAVESLCMVNSELFNLMEALLFGMLALNCDLYPTANSLSKEE